MTDTHILDLNGTILQELQRTIAAIGDTDFEAFVNEICNANRIALHGVGREGLMIRAFAMRLFHLGLDAHVVGDMTTPPLGLGDLLIVSAGPGYLSTIAALVETAQSAGARVACVTAEAQARIPKTSDAVFLIPAQTMASDQARDKSVLPMGSLFEAAQFLVLELAVLVLQDRLAETTQSMRARHTNLE